jgi:hypothetical protein
MRNAESDEIAVVALVGLVVSAADVGASVGAVESRVLEDAVDGSRVGVELGVAVELLLGLFVDAFNAFCDAPRIPLLLLRTIKVVVSAVATSTIVPRLVAASCMVLRFWGDIWCLSYCRKLLMLILLDKMFVRLL